MKPRIYTYKITFEEISHFYFGIHKERKFGETYWGTPISHAWMWDFYTPHKQILEFFETWEEGKVIEDRLIRPYLNDPLCLNEAVGFFMSTESCRRGGLIAAAKAEKEGYGLYAPKTDKQLESSRKCGREIGFMYGVENGRRVGTENYQLGRGIFSMSKENLLESCSKGGKTGGKNTGSQKWIDPDHPELGEKPACVLVQMQKRRGLPHFKENRIRVQ